MSIQTAGPAGPLYALHSNGTHPARLLGVPLPWAIIDQNTLPTELDWYSLVDYEEVPSEWARNYERAYPEALAASGIPADSWQPAQQWHDWLTRPQE